MRLEEFKIDPQMVVYTSGNAKEIDYRDSSERYLLDLFDRVKDLSSSSQELVNYIKDWPTEYHLSPLRANILRALDFLKPRRFKRVLELGAGCGAITRWLGENFEEVHAVEGSFERAAIARKRCKDLGGVKVFCANIQDLSPEPVYDIVTLIGVLEYAPMFLSGFSSGEEACLSMLKKALSFLKPGGLLVLAIENKFGLKYWSGCREDHTGRLFDGIHGYPVKGTPITFSRDELENLLAASGFNCIDFYFPFPDYKMCDTVIRDDKDVKSSFAYNWIKTPFKASLERAHIFHEGLSLRNIVNSGLLSQFSNSFLIVASSQKKKPYRKPRWLVKRIVNGSSFSKSFHYVVTLKRDREGDFKVVREPLYGQARSLNLDVLSFRLEKESSFVPGDSLLFEAYEAIYSGRFELEFSRILEELKEFLFSEFATGRSEDGYPLLEGQAIDCTLWNIIRKDGKFHFIDRKWKWNGLVSIDFVIFRSLLRFCTDNSPYLKFFEEGNLERIMLHFLRKLFPGYQEERLDRCFEREIEFQEVVVNGGRLDFKVSIITPVFNKVEYSKNCLRSLYRVTPHSMFELIVVDNGSTDGTPEFLERFSQRHGNIRVIRNERNLGFAKACNQGARRARGRYIVFLNNDTIPLGGWLEELVKVAENEANVGAVGAKLLFPDGTIQHAGVAVADHPLPINPFHVFYRLPSNHPDANAFKDFQAVTAACMLVPKNLFDELGGFDEGFLNGYEDVDFCFRLREAGYRVVYTPRSVLYHYESVSEGRFKAVEENERRLLNKWLGKVKPDVEVNPPKVSIVILNYNGSHDTIECLESIYNKLMYKSFQVVLVDNGSDPEDVSSLKKWIGSSGVKREGNFEKELIFIESKENLGFSGGNNLGIKYALSRGADYIWLLNNDTVVTHYSLDSLVSVAEKERKIGLVTSKIYCYDDPRKVQYNGKRVFYEGVDDSGGDVEPRHVDVISGCSLLMKSVFLGEIGLLDEDYFLYFEDNDIFTRALKARWKAYYCPTSIVYHKGGASIGQWLRTPVSVYYATKGLLTYGMKSDARNLASYFSYIRDSFYPELQGDKVLVYAMAQGIEDFLRGIKGKSNTPFGKLEEVVKRFETEWSGRLSRGGPRAEGYKDRFNRVKAEVVLSPGSVACLEKFLSVAQAFFLRKFSSSLDLEVDEAERLYEKGDVEGAISKLNDVLWLDPDSFKAHNGLAFIYWQTGKQKEALEHAVKAMELAPNDRDVVWNAGQIMIGLGYIKDAYEMYKSYLERHPEEGEIREIVEKMEESLKGS